MVQPGLVHDYTAGKPVQCCLPDLRNEIRVCREYDQEDDGGAGEGDGKVSHVR